MRVFPPKNIGVTGNTIDENLRDSEAILQKISSFPFIKEEDTVSYIRNHGRVMFIIRGPPFSKKTALSDSLRNIYPDHTFCCAVRNINKFIPEGQSYYAGRENVVETHKICVEEVTEACKADIPIIIVQNSFSRKWEVEFYLNLASQYHYTIVMAITIKPVEPQVIGRTKELDYMYQYIRVKQWENILPLFTGWFMSPGDSEHIQYLTLNILETLCEYDEFKSFILHHENEIKNYFKRREVLNCFASFCPDIDIMKKYYFSDIVQSSYGKAFTIIIVGYLITETDVIGIVHLNDEMKKLVLPDVSKDFPQQSDGKYINYSKFQSEFPKLSNLSEKTTVQLKNWRENEEINVKISSLIHLAQRNNDAVDVVKIKKVLRDSLQLVPCDDGIIPINTYSKLSDHKFIKICKLSNGIWLVKAPRKIYIKTIFTGFYV